MKSKNNTYTYKTESGNVNWIYSQQTKWERIQLVKILEQNNYNAQPSDLIMYNYYLENKNLKVIIKSAETIADDLIVIKQRTVETVISKFLKCGILKKGKVGYVFCRIKHPELESAKKTKETANSRSRTPQKMRTNINQEDRLIKKQEERKKKAQAEYENYCSRKAEDHFKNLPEPEKVKIKAAAAEITNQFIQDPDTPIYRESVRKNILNLIREHIQLPHFLEFFHDRSRVE